MNLSKIYIIDYKLYSDIPLLELRLEFPTAGARLTDSFWFKDFIILKYFFFSIEIRRFMLC